MKLGTGVESNEVALFFCVKERRVSRSKQTAGQGEQNLLVFFNRNRKEIKMIEESRIIKTMEGRGFTESFREEQQGKLISITFTNEATESVPTIFCTVILASEHFQFCYVVPQSANQLLSPDCGSVMNGRHFDMIYSRFREQAAVLHQYWSK